MTVSYTSEVPNGSNFGCFWPILSKWVGKTFFRFSRDFRTDVASTIRTFWSPMRFPSVLHVFFCWNNWNIRNCSWSTSKFHLFQCFDFQNRSIRFTIVHFPNRGKPFSADRSAICTRTFLRGKVRDPKRSSVRVSTLPFCAVSVFGCTFAVAISILRRLDVANSFVAKKHIVWPSPMLFGVIRTAGERSSSWKLQAWCIPCLQKRVYLCRFAIFWLFFETLWRIFSEFVWSEL